MRTNLVRTFLSKVNFKIEINVIMQLISSELNINANDSYNINTNSGGRIKWLLPQEW